MKTITCFSIALLGVMASATGAIWYVDAANTGQSDGTSWATAFPTIAMAITAAQSGDEIWVAGPPDPASFLKRPNPASQVQLPGTAVTFSFIAAGSGPFTYQWWKDDVPLIDDAWISGSWNARLTIANAQVADRGTYWCSATGPYGPVRSANAALNINDPGILAHPESQVVAPGAPISFTIEIDPSSTPPVAYQWRKDGMDIPGATNPTYPIPNALKADEGVYTCRLAGAQTVISNPATLTVQASRYFESIMLKDGVSLYGGFLGPHLGLPGETLREERNPAANETIIDGSRAQVEGEVPAFHVVTGGNNTVLDGFTITRGGDAGEACQGAGGVDRPVIQLQPESQTVDPGLAVTFSVQATGSGPLTYQWSKNCTYLSDGPHMSGTTSSTLAITPPLAPDDMGRYRCIVGSNTGSTESYPALLIVSEGLQDHGAGMFNDSVSSVHVENCRFTGNLVKGYGGAIYSQNSSGQITRCAFTGNVAAQAGAVYSKDSAVGLNQCNFTANRATLNGGAVAAESTQPNQPQQIDACAFSRNEAVGSGGALYMTGGKLIMNNALFRKNSADTGGALACDGAGSGPLLWNCTFLDNAATTGAAINNAASSIVATNCIFWDLGPADELHDTQSGALFTVSNSDIRGGFTGNNNIPTDPQFVQQFFALTKPGGDLSLAPSSPCLNTGTATGAPPTDILGEPRPGVAGHVDMGAHQRAADALSLDPPLDVQPVVLVNAQKYTISGTAPAGSLVVISGGDELSREGDVWDPVYQRLREGETHFSATVPLRQPGVNSEPPYNLIPAVNMITVAILQANGSITSPAYCTIIAGDAFPPPPKDGAFPKQGLVIYPDSSTTAPQIVNQTTALFQCKDGAADVTGCVAWGAYQDSSPTTPDDNINYEGGAYALPDASGSVNMRITASLGGMQSEQYYNFTYHQKQDGGSKATTSHAIMSYVTNRYLGTALTTGCSVTYQPPTPAGTLSPCGLGNYSKLLTDGQYTLSAIATGFKAISTTQSNVSKTLKVNFALWPDNPANPGVSTYSPVKDSESGGDPLLEGAPVREEGKHYPTVYTNQVTVFGSAVGRDSYLRDVSITVTEPDHSPDGTPIETPRVTTIRILNKLSPSLTFEAYRLEPFEVSQRPNGFYRVDVPLDAGTNDRYPYTITITATNAEGHNTSDTLNVIYAGSPAPVFQVTSDTGNVFWREEGAPLAFNVTVRGATGLVTYQWSKDGVDIPGVVDPAFGIAWPLQRDSGHYRCTVMDESKGITWVDIDVLIVPEGGLPVAGLVGLGALLMALLGGGAAVVRRSRKA